MDCFSGIFARIMRFLTGGFLHKREPVNEDFVAWKGECASLQNVLAEKEKQLDGIKQQARQKAADRLSAKTELEALIKAVEGISFDAVGEGSEKFEKEDEVAEVDQILSQLNRQLESLSDNMQSELIRLNDEFSIWKEQCAELQNILEEKMEKLKVIKMKSPSAKADIGALIKEVDGISFEEVGDGSEKFEKEEQITEVDQILAHLNRLFESLFDDLQKEHATLNDEFSIWKDKCGALGKVLEEKEAEFNDIKKQVRMENSDVLSAKANLEALIKAVEGTSFDEVSEGSEKFEKEDQLAEVDQICDFLNRQLETLLTEMASELERY